MELELYANEIAGIESVTRDLAACFVRSVKEATDCVMKQNISTKISQSSEEVKVEDVTQELQAQIHNL